MKPIQTIGFIGLGLIGGSIARLLREQSGDYDIFTYDHHTDRCNPGMEAALADGTLNRIEHDLSCFSSADLIFLCAPVLRNIDYLKKLKTIIRPDCILTDVGSVKGNIHAAAHELGLDTQFIGGHPMAGSELTGYANSSTMLLENAYYILTPTEATPADVRDYMIELIRSFRALPILLGAKEHDNITAAISHVPHIIAAELVNLVRLSDDPSEKMRLLAAGGFKDITRIASSSPEMWQNICLTNANSIKTTLDAYIAALTRVSHAIEQHDSDYLYELFDTASDYRSGIPNYKGLMNRIYELYVDITDEIGAIATIATLFCSNNISIKNMGIIHNREFEQGVLRVEFYDEDALTHGRKVLSARQYKIYDRK